MLLDEGSKSSEREKDSLLRWRAEEPTKQKNRSAEQTPSPIQKQVTEFQFLKTNMEEYDDLSVGPKDGVLDLSHNTWKILPPELNLSNKLLTKIPKAIGNLILLKSLNVSLNRLSKIDGAIGKCLRLRKLNVEKYHLECLPDETGQCVLLVREG